jgi:hypothetical protein
MWLKRGALEEIDGGIDVDSEQAQAHLRGERVKSTKVAGPKKASKPRAARSTAHKRDIEDALSERELKLKKLQIDVESAEIKNLKATGALVSRELVKKTVFSPIEQLFQELLQVFPEITAEKLHARFAGGASKEQGVSEIRKSLEVYIQRTKRAMDVALDEEIK